MVKENKYSVNKKIKVGFLGRINKDKGIEIIEKLSLDKDLLNKFIFYIAGPYEDNLFQNNSLNNRNKFSNKNLIIEKGYKAKELFFESIDVFIMPSRREGFGSTVLEAQACAIPVVCSSIYGLKDSLPNYAGGYRCENYNSYKNALIELSRIENYLEYMKRSIYFSLSFRRSNFKKSLEDFYNKHIT